MNGRKPFFYLLIFIAGIVFTLILGALGTGFRGLWRHPDSGELKQRLEQVNRDLNTAIESQREAERRATRLQEELLGITEHARSIEEGARRAGARVEDIETRTGNLAEQLGGVIDRSGELAVGIKRASDSLEESRNLLDELGDILRGLPGNGGKAD